MERDTYARARQLCDSEQPQGQVEPAERTAAASVTSLARSAGSSASPILSGALLQGPLLALGLPLLLAGGLKAAYDLVLWAVFHRVPEETVTKEAGD